MIGPILLVVDDHTIRHSLRDWLAVVFHGLDVLEADCGWVAAVAPAQPPRVILVDVDLAEVSAPQLIRRLKAIVPSAELIALTMDDHEALQEGVRAAGALACVRKTKISERLLPMLKQLLEPTADAAPHDPRTWKVVCTKDEVG